MDALNVEIKARCNKVDDIRQLLNSGNARFVGLDHQIDTYFRVPQGRLKLRQGNIEKALIYYQRLDQQGPKQSDVKLYRFEGGNDLRELLSTSLGELVVVDKQREIYFIENVKFHIDLVEKLGTFVEIEAIDKDGSRSSTELLEQCEHYLKLFKIDENDLVSDSYSDLLMSLNPKI